MVWTIRDIEVFVRASEDAVAHKRRRLAEAEARYAEAVYAADRAAVELADEEAELARRRELVPGEVR